MFGSMQRTLMTQWRIRKDLVFLCGSAYFVFGADHLWFRKVRHTLFTVGLYHDNLNLTSTGTKVNEERTF